MHYEEVLRCTFRTLPETYEEALGSAWPSAVGAFCEWACHLDGDGEAARRAELTDFAGIADPEQLRQLTVELLSPLSLFQDRASDSARMHTAPDELYPSFRQAVLAERLQISRLYAAESPSPAAWSEDGDPATAAPVMELAFVCGHGGRTASTPMVRVPQGMTVHFIAQPEDLALTTNALTTIARGGSAGATESYGGGEEIPNYVFAPEESDLDASLSVQANAHDLPLYFIGDKQWDLSAPESTLCTDPALCSANGTGRHACRGFLTTLSHVQNLYLLTCRARDDAPEAPAFTYRLPGEWMPFGYLGDNLDSTLGSLMAEPDLLRKLKELECEDPARLARIFSTPQAQSRLLVRQAREFLHSEGRIAYLALYTNLTENEQGQLDAVDSLREARTTAQAKVDAFVQASAHEREDLLEELLSEVEGAKRHKQLMDFLGYRAPSFWTWRKNPADYDGIVAGARPAIHAGGRYSGLYNSRLDVLLIADAAGRFDAYDAQLVAKVRQDGIRMRVVLVPRTKYVALPALGDRPAPQRVREALEELVRVVRGPDTVFH